MLTPNAPLFTDAPGRPPSPAAWRGAAPVPEPGPGSAAGLSLSWRTQGEHAIAALIGELDIACAAVLREQLLSLLRLHAARLVIDLSGVSYCDASGLAVLVGTGRRAELLGGVLRLAAPTPPVDSALRVTGLHRRFDIFPTVSAAVAAAPVPGTPVASRPGILLSPPAKMGASVASGAARVRRAAGPATSGPPSPRCSPIPMRGGTLTPTADSLPPSRSWPAPMPAPATPAPTTRGWPRRPARCCPSSPSTPSPTPRRSPPRRAACAGSSTPADQRPGGPGRRVHGGRHGAGH